MLHVLILCIHKPHCPGSEMENSNIISSM